MASRFCVSEVIISSYAGKSSRNWIIEDAHTGSVLATGKHVQCSPRTLCVVGRDYLINAVPESPVVNVWPFQERSHMKKMIVPGVVTALAVSYQGHHMVAAIDTKLYIWEVATGNLLRIFGSHYQKVNCIKFTKDATYIITGGADAQTMVWMVAGVLSSEISNAENEKMNVIKPTYTWSDHTLAVEDIYVGYFGSRANVVSVSRDHTCKVRHLATGQLILSIYMEVELVSVCMDPAERFIFLGTMNGDIHCVMLASCCSTTEVHYDATKENVFRVFSGHKEAVTCLSLSFDARTLLSGSEDGCLKLWNVLSQMCTKTIQREGSITNAMLLMTPPLLRKFKDGRTEVCELEFGVLKRNIHKGGENTDEDNAFENPFPVQLKNQKLRTWDLACGNDLLDGIRPTDDIENSKAQLKNEVGTMNKTNEQMYCYVVDAMMSGMGK